MLLAGSFAFSVLFKALRRDMLLVMASVWLGYGVMRRRNWSRPGRKHDADRRVPRRPGGGRDRQPLRPGGEPPSALIPVPGIILLVPGSLGFRSFNLVFEHDVMLGLDTAIAVMSALIALVAGILFGNLLMPTRRNI
jgi:uncharacterized membrane protein YjjB (DUF3815 family)